MGMLSLVSAGERHTDFELRESELKSPVARNMLSDADNRLEGSVVTYTLEQQAES
jgi:hypothetical protein